MSMEEHDNTRKPSRVNETNQHSALRTQQAERRRIQKLLTDIQSQQKAILDSIPDMAWFKDKESKYIAVNEMFGQTCGWKPKDIVGKTDLDIWPRHLAERYLA